MTAHATALAATLALLAFLVQPARAQEATEQNFKQAVNSYNAGHIDEACELFKKIQSEKPDYPQLKDYLRPACDAAEDVHKAEDRLFSQGQQAEQQGQCTEARQKFDSAARLALVHPKHKGEIAAILQSCIQKEKQLQAAKDLIKRGQNDQARSALGQLASAGCPVAQDAKDTLAMIPATPKLPPPRQVTQPKPPPTHVEPVAPSGGTETASQDAANDQRLRDGLHHYFEGQYDDAERSLADYLQNNGKKQALAYFFRGAIHGTRYYISGEKDNVEKGLAAEDFEKVKRLAAQFRPPEKYVSPKILALYSDVVRQ